MVYGHEASSIAVAFAAAPVRAAAFTTTAAHAIALGTPVAVSVDALTIAVAATAVLDRAAGLATKTRVSTYLKGSKVVKGRDSGTLL